MQVCTLQSPRSKLDGDTALPALTTQMHGTAIVQSLTHCETGYLRGRSVCV